MKKSFFGLMALALAFGFSAFTSTATLPQTAAQTQYHWFDAQTGQYLGMRTIDSQESLCPGAGADCASAYTGKTANNQPSGSFVATVQRQL